MLDELPYGYFIEIEGLDAASIHVEADSLSLKWETAITESYLMLFERLGKTRGLTFGEVRFANFTHLNITATDLGVCPAWDWNPRLCCKYPQKRNGEILGCCIKQSAGVRQYLVEHFRRQTAGLGVLTAGMVRT